MLAQVWYSRRDNYCNVLMKLCEWCNKLRGTLAAGPFCQQMQKSESLWHKCAYLAFHFVWFIAMFAALLPKPQSAELWKTNGRIWVTMSAHHTVRVSGSSTEGIAALCCYTPQDSTSVEMSWCSCLFMSQQFPSLGFLEERKTSQDRSLLTLWPN